MLQQTGSPSRRFNARIESPEDVWVYWQCDGRDEASRVRDVSLGGLFVETPKPRSVGSTVKVDFLVDEGQIRAEAVVRHVKPGRGLGLKFTALTDADRPHLGALMSRLRSFSRKHKTRSNV
jgi:PilZ domain-containing protein